jgi:hypothetical protein
MQEIVDRLQPLKKRLRDSLPKAVLDEIDGKKWLPVSFVVFDKDEGPCDPYNNGDHSDCCDHECKVDPEGGYAQ